MSSKRTLKTLSVDQKFKLIKEVESGSRNKDVTVKCGIPANTVSIIYKCRQSSFRVI